MVDKEKFGTRHTCPSCECKFYDFNRVPAICPKCGFDPTAPEELPEEQDDSEDELPDIDVKGDDSLPEKKDDLPEDE